MEGQKFFFSYSRIDASDFALKLYNDLQKCGANIWIDQLDIEGGKRWDAEIEKALKACQCVLFIVSEESVISDNVLDEVSYALKKKKQVIPIFISDCEIPYRFERLQGVNFNKDYNAGFNLLLKTLKLDGQSGQLSSVQQSTNKEDINTKLSRLFIAYSAKNTDFMKRFETHLEPLKHNGTIGLWYDRMIDSGTKWDESIREEIRTADVIIFLLSPDFIANSYFFKYEMPQAIKQVESENSKLFLVILQPCSWDRTILAGFQQTTDPYADNKGIIVIGDPMNDIKWKYVIDELEKRIVEK